MSNSKRNEEIVAFCKANDWSYQLIADRFGVSRSTVAGIMFRHRHPPKARIGLGYSSISYWPAYTAKNAVVR